MTPEEKAKELSDKIKEVLLEELMSNYDNGNISDTGISGGDEAIKKCTLICAKETLKQLSEMIKPEYITFWHGDFSGSTIDGTGIIDFWETVVKELEK